MSDFTYWSTFLLAALALNLAPGPDLIYVLSRSVAHGRRIGLASAAGVCTGAFIHVVGAAFGIAALIATSSTAFNVVKYAGAAYLLYLGLRAWLSSGVLGGWETDRDSTAGAFQAFRQGVLTDILNPKVAIFFMAFLPQFLRPDHGSPTMQLIVLGVIVIFIAIAFESALVLVADRTSTVLKRNRVVRIWLDRAFGTVLVGLSLKLATSKIP